MIKNIAIIVLSVWLVGALTMLGIVRWPHKHHNDLAEWMAKSEKDGCQLEKVSFPKGTIGPLVEYWCPGTSRKK